MAPKSSPSGRKRQTRLQFTPLPSSSPVKVNYSSAIQDRLASVRFDRVRQSHRPAAASLGDETAEDETGAGVLPTPAASSQAQLVSKGKVTCFIY